MVKTATEPASKVTSYLYDPAGNMCWNAPVTMPSSPSCATPPTGATSYAFDAAGYLKSSSQGGTPTTYTTNAMGELTAAKVGTGTASTYQYDPWGRQTQAVIPTGLPGAGTYNYKWDSLGRMLSDTPTSGSATTYAYVGTSFNPVTISLGSTATQLAYTPEGPLAQKTGTGVAQYLVANLHGDVVAAAGQGTNALTSGSLRAYDPWGNLRTGYTTTWTNLGYQGQPTDAKTGQVDMQHRLYSPSLARFTTQDSVFGQLKSPTSLNQFAYAGDDPATNTDPTGNYFIRGGDDGCGAGCATTVYNYPSPVLPYVYPFFPRVTFQTPEFTIARTPGLEIKVSGSFTGPATAGPAAFTLGTKGLEVGAGASSITIPWKALASPGGFHGPVDATVTGISIPASANVTYGVDVKSTFFGRWVMGNWGVDVTDTGTVHLGSGGASLSLKFTYSFSQQRVPWGLNKPVTVWVPTAVGAGVKGLQWLSQQCEQDTGDPVCVPG